MIGLQSHALVILVCGLVLSAPLSAETLRLSLEGQLNDDGLGVNSDYDNATYSGFFEIDLDNPQNDSSSARFYDFTSWDIELVPEPPNPNDAPVIRFASDREPDDTAIVLLERSQNRLFIIIREDNAPSSRRTLSVRFDPNFDFRSSTRFEELLTEDRQSFVTAPAFISGGLQFATSQFSTSVAESTLAVSLQTATRYVDGVTGDDQGGGNGCAVLANPCATIQQAIDSAQAGDTIEIADAVYTEMLDVDKALAMRGQSRAGTIIQAAASRGVASNRVISVADDTDFELSDATIRHGRAGVSTGSSDNGGGLECLGGDLLLERVTFTANDAKGAGAGLASGDNIVVMTDVIFSENGTSATNNGGGVFLGENFVVTDVTLTNVVFENNTVDGSGGGLRLFNVQAVLTDVAFVSNSSITGSGGGMNYTGSNSVDSTLELRETVFIGNSATEGGGGGMDTTFDTPYTMVNVLFSGNLANLGGALFNSSGTSGDRILTNVTISGNRATLRGGGIDSPSDMVLRNTIIWNNQDETGIGTAEANLRDRFRNAVVEVSNSLLQGYLPDVWPGSNNLNGTDAGNNPLFRDAVNPGGAPSLAGDLRLQFESPVRDVGNNSFVTGITTDLDGNPRIVGGTVDLGAFEGDDLLFSDGFEDTDSIL